MTEEDTKVSYVSIKSGKSLNGIQIRAAISNDALAVARVYHHGWHAGHATVLPWLVPARPLTAFEAKTPEILLHCLVAETVEEKLAGFAAWYGPELRQLFIDQAWAGVGLGQHLLAASEAAMRGEGVEEASLTCVVGNERARIFYLRQGWTEREIEDYPAKVGGGVRMVAVWRMTKLLQP